MWEWVSNIMKPEAVDTWAGTVTNGIEAMQTRLSNEAEVRIYIDNTPNFGNQASSVLLMKTLIDSYGFSGDGKQVTLLYKAAEAADTRKKLSILLQGFNYTNPDATAAYAGVPIRFMTMEALMTDGAIGTINFGFSGGADKGEGGDESTNNWFAINSKVNFFLRLQAYLWPYPQQIQYAGAFAAIETYDLNANVGDGGTYQKTGWYVRDQYWEPIPEDWTYYKNDTNPGVDAGTVLRTELAQVLVDFLIAQPGAVRFLPLYGIKGYPNQTGVVPWVALSSVVATALGGSDLLPDKTPTIVLSMNDDLGDSDFFNAYYVSKGEMTAFEDSAEESVTCTEDEVKELRDELEAATTANDEAEKDRIGVELQDAIVANARRVQINTLQQLAFNARKTWLEERNSADGVRFISSRKREVFDTNENWQVDPQSLDAALTLLIAPETEKPAILFFELGPLPTVLFNYIFSLASFPSIFEGANSANLALNMGSCYLRMENPDKIQKVDRYPDAWALNSNAYTAVHAQSTAAANAVIAALNSSQEQPAENFVQCMGQTTGYIDAYYIHQDPRLLEYYLGIKHFFHHPKNDKLGIGLACLNQAAIANGIPVPD